MKKSWIWLIAFLLLLPNIVMAKEREDVTLYLFHSSTCPHCKAEIAFLNEIQDEYEYLHVELHEVNKETDLVDKVRKEMGIDNSYVPLTVIGSETLIGFSDDIENQIKDALDAYSKNDHCDVVSLIKQGKDIKKCNEQNKLVYSGSNLRTLPILGTIDIKETSLPLISVILGLVDGFNPCAMWVLIFLITMLFDMKNRKKMWILGLTFLISSALIYLSFMLAWLGVISSVTQSWFRYIIALVALIAGIINLISFIKSLNKDTGCQVVNSDKRKKLMNKIKKITHEKSFILAMIGMVVLAFSVNLVELACSAGIPVLFTQILSMNQLHMIQYILYFSMYILFFLIDDIIVFAIAMITLKITGISNKYTKYSHLIGGIIMLLIGLMMIFKPEWIMFNF